MARIILLLCLWLGLSMSAEAQLSSQDKPQTTVQPLQVIADDIRSKHKLAGVGVSLYRLQTDGSVTSQTRVSGHRRAGFTPVITPDDLWHIGSCTKAMTALLYGELMQAQGWTWDRPLADIFKPHIKTIDPAWQTLTMADVLTHRAGIKDLGISWSFNRNIDERPLREQRLETAATILATPPKQPAGDFNYSNMGYIIAGSAIEIMSGRSWEEAMRDGLPGQIMGETGWGFGPPQGEQPEGHRKKFFRNTLNPQGQIWKQADNTPALGPAGTIHVSHDVWAKFAMSFLREDSLIPPNLKQILLTPPKQYPDADYAMGWGVTQAEGVGTLYTHAGSNTFWVAQILMIPSEKAIIIVTTNSPYKRGEPAIREASRRILNHLK